MMGSFLRFISESVQTYDAKKLRAVARKAGESLFKSHRSGLLLGDLITVLPYENFVSEDDSYDTWMFVFDPNTGKGWDFADSPIKESHAIHGVIHVGWPDGIILVPLPGIKIQVTGNGSKTVIVPEIQAKTKDATDPEILKMSSRIHGLGFYRIGRDEHPQIWKKMYPENVEVEVHIEMDRSCIDSMNMKTWRARDRENFSSVSEMEDLIEKHSKPILR